MCPPAKKASLLKYFILSVSHRKFLANYFFARLQSTSATHFSCSSKYRRTPLQKTYHRVFDFLNQKARVRANFCYKRLISCFRRCDVFINTPHSKNTQSNRFSSNYHRKLCCLYRNRKSPVPFLFAAHFIKISSQIGGFI